MVARTSGATRLIAADSLEGEGGPWPRRGCASPLNGERLFAFTRLDPSQWRSARTTNAIERRNEEFRRRIKTHTVLPCAGTVPMPLRALLASGHIVLRKVRMGDTLSAHRALRP
jgi:transposase-like protein